MFTYLFYNPEDGLTKIGRSRHPVSRFGALSSGRDLEPICVFSGDTEVEKHELHKDDRIAGEWFKLTEDQITEYRSNPENLITFDTDGEPILPGSIYGAARHDRVVINVALTEDQIARLDAIAKREKRARKNQAAIFIMEKVAETEAAKKEDAP